MKIRMVNNMGKEFVLDNISPNDTIGAIKTRFSPFIPKPKQLFFYELHLLNDSTTVAEYQMEDNAAILYVFDHFEK